MPLASDTQHVVAQAFENLEQLGVDSTTILVMLEHHLCWPGKFEDRTKTTEYRHLMAFDVDFHNVGPGEAGELACIHESHPGLGALVRWVDHVGTTGVTRDAVHRPDPHAIAHSGLDEVDTRRLELGEVVAAQRSDIGEWLEGDDMRVRHAGEKGAANRADVGADIPEAGSRGRIFDEHLGDATIETPRQVEVSPDQIVGPDSEGEALCALHIEGVGVEAQPGQRRAIDDSALAVVERQGVNHGSRHASVQTGHSRDSPVRRCSCRDTDCRSALSTRAAN